MILKAQVTCGNLTSSPYYYGVQSWGPMSVTSASGCAEDQYNGTTPWRTSGCKAGDVVLLQGTGLGGFMSVYVGPTVSRTFCDLQFINNSAVNCTLPRLNAAGVWLSLLAYAGTASATGSNLVLYASNNTGEEERTLVS